MSKFVQFWFTPFTIVIFWGGRLVCDAYTEPVLPNMALITLDEETIRRIGLFIVTALIFLVATDASGDLILLRSLIDFLITVTVRFCGCFRKRFKRGLWVISTSRVGSFNFGMGFVL